MKVLLIQPPVEDFYDTAIRTYPLGLASIAAGLQRERVDVEILDCHTPDAVCQIPLPEKFSFIEPYYRHPNLSPFKLFTRYFHFGLMWDQIEDEIRQCQPNIVGISANFSPYFNCSLRIAQIVKGLFPGCIIVMGGSHVNSLPEEILKHSEIDYIILGEGEERFLKLLNAIQTGRPIDSDGIGYRQDGHIVIERVKTYAEDLDCLPYSAMNLLDAKNYTINDQRYSMILSSRGCPQKCTFCSVHLVMGDRHRKRSPENILDEMRQLYEQYNIRIFDFEDDNFTLDRDRLITLLQGIINLFPKNAITLTAMNGLSLKNLDEEVLGLLKEAGLKDLNIATVSTREEVIEDVQRPHTYDEFKKVICAAFGQQLPVTAYIILGLPGDTIESMLDSICALAQEPVLIGPSIFYPTPGTRIYAELKEKGLVHDERCALYRSSLASIETNDFSRVDILTLMRCVRMVNYLKRLGDDAEAGTGLSDLLAQSVIEITEAFTDDVLVRREALLPDEIALILLTLFWKKKKLYGLDRKKNRRTLQYNYSFFEEPQSERVNTLFLTALRDKSVIGHKTGKKISIDI